MCFINPEPMLKLLVLTLLLALPKLLTRVAELKCTSLIQSRWSVQLESFALQAILTAFQPVPLDHSARMQGWGPRHQLLLLMQSANRWRKLSGSSSSRNSISSILMNLV